MNRQDYPATVDSSLLRADLRRRAQLALSDLETSAQLAQDRYDSLRTISLTMALVMAAIIVGLAYWIARLKGWV